MNKSNFVEPVAKLSAFNCPFCGVYAKQGWYIVAGLEYGPVPNQGDRLTVFGDRTTHITHPNDTFFLCACEHCEKHSIWKDDQLVYPSYSTAPSPSEDIPEEVKATYLEAREIANKSPRGACALLRLAIQQLLPRIGGKGESINQDIALLVKNGLPVKVQQGLDSIRVIGNNAVHPGLIDLKDNINTATTLFKLINLIVQNQITEPKEVQKIFDELPQSQKDQIKKRDS